MEIGMFKSKRTHYDVNAWTTQIKAPHQEWLTVEEAWMAGSRQQVAAESVHARNIMVV